MDDHEIASKSVNPWWPMTAPIDLKHLGKLGEEAGELASAVGRCIVQGIDDREPDSGKTNREWLEDEIADVYANAHLVTEHFELDRIRIEARMLAKIEKLKVWHNIGR